MRAKPTIAALALAAGIAFFGADMAAAAGADTAAAEGAKPDKAKRICRTIVASGTRMGKRYCRSQEEWDRAGDKNRDFVMDSQFKNARRDGEFVGMDRGHVQ